MVDSVDKVGALAGGVGGFMIGGPAGAAIGAGLGGGLMGGVDPPDPGASAATQQDINRQAAYESAALNQIQQFGPGYSIGYSGEIGDPNRTMYMGLDPYREALAQAMGQQVLDSSAMIGGPIDYRGVAPIPGGDVPQFNVPAFSPDTNVGRFSTTSQVPTFSGNVPMPTYTNRAGTVDFFAGDTNVPRYANTSAAVPTYGGARQDIPIFDYQQDIPVFQPGDYGQRAADVEQTMYEAIMSRARPDIDRTRAAQETMLAGRGIPMGGAAYSDVQESLARQEGDIALGAAGQAIGLGRDEAQRLFGRDIAGYQAQLAGLGQQFGQEATGYQLGLAGLGQQYGQDLSDYQAQLAGQAQQYGQGVTDYQLGLAGQQQQFGQDLGAFQADLAHQAQRYGQGLSDYQAALGAQAQQFGQGLAGYQANLGAQAQQFGQDLGGFQANLAAQGQQYGQELGAHQQAVQDYLASLTGSGQQFGQGMAAHQQGMSNIQFDRNQIAQELALMSNLNPYNQQQVMSPSQYQISPVDYIGAQNAAYQGQVANRGSMIGGLASLGSAGILAKFAPAAISDRRLKTDIIPAGHTEAGIPLYGYRYKGGNVRHIGVMAQDLLFVQPDAVITMPNGYMAVDYSKVH